MIFTKELKVEGEIDVIYDKIIDYFKSLNFDLKQSLKHTRAVLQRGSILFADVGLLKDKFQTKKCELEINLTKEARNVTVKCNYYVPWIISSKSRDMTEINKEVEGLGRFIAVTYGRIKEPSEHVMKEKEIITREIIMIHCKYCGSLFEATAIKCPNCGAGLK